jgi:hypothetical protein
LLISAQLIRTQFEERALTEAFPDYAEYATHTPRLVPLVVKKRRRVGGAAATGGRSHLIARAALLGDEKS